MSSKTKKISDKAHLKSLKETLYWINKYMEDRKLKDDFVKYIKEENDKRNNSNS